MVLAARTQVVSRRRVLMLAFAMPSFSRDATIAIAALANLDLAADEVELFARQLGEILAYVEEVQGVDTAGVEPTAAVLPQQRLERGDLVAASLAVGDALANAPDPAYDAAGGGLFKVPRVIG
jgi:aspartyl-tRNA(Asn)/glutamyl-tRNA(Gln) amidotransferase subunit C